MSNNFLTTYPNRKGIDSREVSQMVGKEHSHLMRDIRGYISAISTNPNLDSLNFFIESSYFDAKEECRPCYICTKMGCDVIANKLSGTKGVIFTATYVSRFNEMEASQSLTQLPDFTNPAIAARAWADEVEKKMLAESQVKELTPASNAWKSVSEDESRLWDFNMAAGIACLTGLTASKFRSMAKDEGWMYKHENKITAGARTGGYMRMVEKEISIGNRTKWVETPCLRPKGYDYLVLKFKRESGVLF
jgi:Rha family phage regulatory protein